MRIINEIEFLKGRSESGITAQRARFNRGRIADTIVHRADDSGEGEEEIAKFVRREKRNGRKSLGP